MLLLLWTAPARRILMSKLSTLLSQSVSLVSSISRHFGFSSMQCGTQLKLRFRWAWDKPVPAAFIYDPSPPNGCAINSNANFRTTGVYIVYRLYLLLLWSWSSPERCIYQISLIPWPGDKASIHKIVWQAWAGSAPLAHWPCMPEQ